MTKNDWYRCTKQLRNEFSNAEVSRWILGISFSESDDGEIQLLVPNKSYIKNINKTKIWNRLLELLDAPDLKLTVRSSPKLLEGSNNTKKHLNPNLDTLLNPELLPTTVLTNETKFEAKLLSSTVSQRQTFNNFVVGQNDNLAYHVLKELSLDGTPKFNPILLSGRSGLGKSHLLHATCNRLRLEFPEKNICFITAVNLTNQLVNAFRHKKINQLKETYNSIDALFIEDIEFLIGKNSTTEEFNQLICQLLENNKQVVLSSSMSSQKLDFPQQVLSKISAGLPIQLSYPDFEQRLLYVESQTQNNPNFTADLKYFIAMMSLKCNFSELKGIMSNLLASLQYRNISKLTIENVRHFITPFISAKHNKTTPESIINAVAKYYSVETTALISKSRRKVLVHARYMAIALIKEFNNSSLSQIGLLFKRDSSTILYALDKFRNLRNKDPQVDSDYNNLYNELSASN